MPQLPFANLYDLRQQNLPIPSKATASALPILDLSQLQTEWNDELKSYALLYGLNALDAQRWQGKVSIEQFDIHVQVFQPKTDDIRGSVWLLHGYLEHSGIYQPIIAELLQHGFSVIVYDLPGHGLSSGASANIDNFADYQKILLNIKHIVQKHVDILPKPWLGIGQSTGGAIWMDHILAFAAERKSPIVERVLLLSPLLRPAKSAWWHNPIGLGVVKLIKNDIPRHFRRNNHNPEFLRFVRLYDPLQPRTMGMGWILAMTRWINDMEQRPACRIPVWVAQGALDETVDWRYNIEYIRKKFRLQTVLMLEEGSHQLINERDDIRVALTGLIPAFLNAQGKGQYY
ncbi:MULTISPECIES: alpha/beta fold hydrolase [unclassified Acinetobacter]|uniref:alpha/beta fold hydrolase n=1 Tax=unclassified Acinetobacter TaxID=196816 RepID=UPI0035BB5B2B